MSIVIPVQSSTFRGLEFPATTVSTRTLTTTFGITKRTTVRFGELAALKLRPFRFLPVCTTLGLIHGPRPMAHSTEHSPLPDASTPRCFYWQVLFCFCTDSLRQTKSKLKGYIAGITCLKLWTQYDLY